MADTGFDVEAAKKAGYSDDEILQHLTQTRKFDVDGAMKAGYSKADIVSHLASTPAPASSPHPTPENPDPNQPGMQPLGTMGQIRQAFSSPAAYAESVKRNAGQIPKFAAAVAEDVKGAATSPSTYLGPSIGGGIDAIKTLYQAAKDGHFQAEPEFLDRLGGALGINTQGVKEAAQRGDLAGVVGHGALPVAGAVALTENKPVAKLASQVAESVPSPRRAMEAAKNAPVIAKEAVFPGPQGKIMPSAAELPILAKSGLEHIFEAAAPTSMNKGFRENLNVAAPDLADIAHKVDISEAKGGVINPDMRVRATVKAIREHQEGMYEQERAPQIQRNANAPVKIGTNANAVRGLEYLEATAGDVADSQIAKKALEERTLTVEEADKLAQLANKTLRSYEKMTPENKLQLQATNPKIGGIKALDSELGSNLNDVLQSRGETGLRAYERRYAALSAVRDQLESRMNATELKQEGMFGFAGRVTRPAVKLFTEGPSGVPSASQAAVADVNIGRSLQMGMSKLKASGISAKRATK
jgi:hypothetical protein